MGYDSDLLHKILLSHLCSLPSVLVPSWNVIADSDQNVALLIGLSCLDDFKYNSHIVSQSTFFICSCVAQNKLKQSYALYILIDQ